jgi:5-methylcytosine-specific restriction endonuclease McrA
MGKKSEHELSQRRKAQARYRARHPERVKGMMRAWYDKNPTYERDRARRRYAADPKYRARVRANSKRFASEHPEYYRAASKLRRARLRGVECTLTGEQVRELFEEYAGLCVYCLGSATTLDHVVPISRGGSHSKDNLVPSCKSDNSKKGTKGLLVFLSNRRAA